jgi:hypothetical protein
MRKKLKNSRKVKSGELLGFCVLCGDVRIRVPSFWELSQEERRSAEAEMVRRGIHPFMEGQWVLQENLRERLLS